MSTLFIKVGSLFSKQSKLNEHTFLSGSIVEKAFNWFVGLYAWDAPVRSIGISVSGFTGFTEQMAVLGDELARERAERLEKSVDKIRKKYGNNALLRGIIKNDKKLSNENIKDDHIIHPEGYFHK